MPLWLLDVARSVVLSSFYRRVGVRIASVSYGDEGVIQLGSLIASAGVCLTNDGLEAAPGIVLSC